MTDDVVAGIYGNLALRLIIWIAGRGQSLVGSGWFFTVIHRPPPDRAD